jgi:excisionase family DNA binding protein
MHSTQKHGAAKRLAPIGDKVASRQYDELRRGKLFHTIKEVVATGLCSRQTLWRLMKAGELGYVNVGTRVLIPHEELLVFVRNHYHKAVD